LEKPTYPVATGIISVVDRHCFDANTDPDPTFHFDANPDPNPTPRFTQKSEIFLLFFHSGASLHCFMFFVSVIDS
jgi:hypothetical protein